MCSAGVSIRSTYIRCGDLAWERVQDRPFQATPTLESIRSLYPFQTLAQLLEIEEDGQVEYVGNYEAEGIIGETIRVTMPGRMSSEVVLDNSTHLVMRISVPAFSPKSGKIVKSVTEFSGYRRNDSLMVPDKRVTRLDDEPFTEVDLRRLEFLETVAEDLFTPPADRSGADESVNRLRNRT